MNKLTIWDYLILLGIGLTLSSLLVGCGQVPDEDGAQFAWQSPKYGVGQLKGNDENYFTPEVFDKSAEHVINGLSTMYDTKPMLWAMQSARVEVKPEDWACLGPYSECAGLELDYKLEVSKAYRASGNNELITRCVWETALMHEMIHLMLSVSTGDPDAGHANKEVWPIAGDRLGDCP